VSIGIHANLYGTAVAVGADWSVPILAGTAGDFGSLRIEIGAEWDTFGTAYAAAGSVAVLTSRGDDATTVSGARTVIPSLEFAEGYGETVGLLEFPALSPFDTGSLPLYEGVNVDIWRVLPAAEAVAAGTVEVGFWHGIVTSLEFTDGPGLESAWRAQLAGALYGEASVRLHQPLMLDRADDVGTWLGRALSPARYSRPFAPFTRFTFDATETGIDIRYRGSRGEYTTDYVGEVLALAQDETAGRWTIRRAFQVLGGRDYPRPRHYYLDQVEADWSTAIQKSVTSVGGYGVSVRLAWDATQAPTAIYGEGVHPVDKSDLSGSRWRNAVYPGLSASMPSYPSRISGATYPITVGDEDGDFTTDAVTQLSGALRAASAPSATIGPVFTSTTGAAIAALKADNGYANTNANIGGTAEWAWLFNAGASYSGADLASGWLRPLAVESTVERYKYTPVGDIAAVNDAYDPAQLRVERIISYGDGISKASARANAREILTLNAPFTGSVGLQTDVVDEASAPRSRFGIREGGWLRLLNGPGGPPIDLYVSAVQFTGVDPGGAVEVTVSEDPLPYLELAARVARDREARENPARSMYAQRVKTIRPFRSVVGWDVESGAGQIPATALGSGVWTVGTVIAAQYGRLDAARVTVSPAQPFCLAVFGGTPVAADIDAIVPDPLAEPSDGYRSWWTHPDNEDALAEIGFVEAWGQYGAPAGYSPGDEGRSGAAGSVTGRMNDSMGWSFASLDPPYLRVAVWCPDGGTLKGSSAFRVVASDEG